MTGVEHYLSIFTKAVFIENIVLAYFLGLCSFLAISKKIDASVGIGLAVIVVLTITAPINWFLWEFLLDKGALVWISQDFKDTDYILCTGDPAIIGLSTAIVSDITNGKFNLLKWDRQETRYYPLSFNLYDKGES